jgi:hypothetical protein
MCEFTRPSNIVVYTKYFYEDRNKQLSTEVLSQYRRLFPLSLAAIVLDTLRERARNEFIR